MLFISVIKNEKSVATFCKLRLVILNRTTTRIVSLSETCDFLFSSLKSDFFKKNFPKKIKSEATNFV